MFDSEQTLVIGVDGGGTGCRAAVGTAEKGILARAEGGRANATSDPEQAIENVITTVKAAIRDAGLSVHAMKGAHAHLGLAGVMSEQDSRRVSDALPFASSTVTDDRPTAIVGALDGQDGFLLSVGTGTIVASSQSGAFSFIGGWGFQISDQSSGAWLGHTALRRTILCHDRLAPHSDLTRGLLAHFGNDPNEIVVFAASAHPGDYAALAPRVIDAAGASDEWGRKIVQDGADYLAKGLLNLGFKSGDTLCLTGGVGPHYAPYLPQDTLAGRVSSKGSALDGAFQLAAGRALSMQGSTS